MRVVAMAAVLAGCFATLGYAAAEGEPGFHRLFHLVGVPGVQREARIDLEPGAEALVFKYKKVRYEVPYTRIQRVLLLRADRRYEGATYAAAVATFGIGGLLILKKHHVDTVVFDYVNERGGKMGIVVQMEREQGEQFRSLMTAKGISLNEPEGSPELGSQDQPKADMADRSKQ